MTAQLDIPEIKHMRLCFSAAKKALFNAYMDPAATYITADTAHDLLRALLVKENMNQLERYLVAEKVLVLLKDVYDMVENHLAQEEKYAKRALLGRVF